MVILDVIFIILGILMFISFRRSKFDFEHWLFKDGIGWYLLKCTFLVASIAMLLIRVDWDFLFIKLF